MKFKAIAAAFKERKSLNVLEAPNGTQWISNGTAMFLMEGMPVLNAAAVLNIFDIPEIKREEWETGEHKMTAELARMCLNNDLYPDDALTIMSLEIVINGSKYLFLKSPSGVFAINEKYLKPLDDEGDYLRFFKKTTSDGKTVAILVYKGLEIKAVILPAHFSGIMPELRKIVSEIYSPANTTNDESEDDNETS